MAAERPPCAWLGMAASPSPLSRGTKKSSRAPELDCLDPWELENVKHTPVDPFPLLCSGRGSSINQRAPGQMDRYSDMTP